MKLVTVIASDDAAGRLIDALVRAGFRATRFESRGGFLRARNNTIYSGVEDERLDEALQVVREACRPRGARSPEQSAVPGQGQDGGATVFVTHVEHFERV